jgi:hypothetical protein
MAMVLIFSALIGIGWAGEKKSPLDIYKGEIKMELKKGDITSQSETSKACYWIKNPNAAGGMPQGPFYGVITSYFGVVPIPQSPMVLMVIIRTEDSELAWIAIFLESTKNNEILKENKMEKESDLVLKYFKLSMETIKTLCP